jgi:hypothetical protein
MVMIDHLPCAPFLIIILYTLPKMVHLAQYTVDLNLHAG